MDGGIIGEGDMWEIIRPIQLLVRRKRLQQSMQGPIKPLTLGIPLRPVRGCVGLLDAI